jgi:hypothetical protein
MSTRNLQTVLVEFRLDNRDPLPTSLMFGLAGVCEALDRLREDDDAQECVGNLATAAKALAKQLVNQID